MSQPTRMAFYDFDGTLASSNVVLRYAYYVRKLPSRARALLKFSKLLLSVPVLVGLDFYSRRLFNEIFYREYRGMKKGWLLDRADSLFEDVIRRSIYSGARSLVESDRDRGFRLVLVTGELDFALGPVMRYFGFDELISNALVYENGTATGEVAAPLIAGDEKVAAMKRLCRLYNADTAESKAYSDSFSDAPMLEAVGKPIAVNPDWRLARLAAQRGWQVMDLKRGDHVHVHPEGRDSGPAGV